MARQLKKKRKSENPPALDDASLEQIIENRKIVADAYRKILDSLEKKFNKNK